MNRRRRNKTHLLDVKVQTDGRRRRHLQWVAGVLAVLGVVALSSYGVWRLLKLSASKMVDENPRFTIKQIIVENKGALTPQQVAAFGGVAVGQNLLSLDLDRIRGNLEMLPLVRRVEVRRMLPQKLFIHVDERTAVARLRVPGNSEVLIDRSGFVMQPLRLADGTVVRPHSVGTLPMLNGVSLVDVQVGKQVQSEQVYRALDLIDRLQQASAGAMMEVDSVELSKPRQLTLKSRQNTVVKFDTEDYTQQLRRLSAILTWSVQRQKIVQSVDLTIARGVPVAFLN